ncbi:hypothetical protein [Bacillus tequilensis]|nr:hypothetical protein [Bacillus tequilensis]
MDTQSSEQIMGGAKSDYAAKMSATEQKERHNDYQSDYQMIEDHGYHYQMWDALLNEIYGVLQPRNDMMRRAAVHYPESSKRKSLLNRRKSAVTG